MPLLLSKREGWGGEGGSERGKRLSGLTEGPGGPQRKGPRDVCSARDPPPPAGFLSAGSATQPSLTLWPPACLGLTTLPGPSPSRASVKSRTDGQGRALSEDIWKRPGQSSEWEWAPGPAGRQRGTGAPPWNWPGEGGAQAERQLPPHTESQAAVAPRGV